MRFFYVNIHVSNTYVCTVDILFLNRTSKHDCISVRQSVIVNNTNFADIENHGQVIVTVEGLGFKEWMWHMPSCGKY